MTNNEIGIGLSYTDLTRELLKYRREVFQLRGEKASLQEMHDIEHEQLMEAQDTMHRLDKENRALKRDRRKVCHAVDNALNAVCADMTSEEVILRLSKILTRLSLPVRS